MKTKHTFQVNFFLRKIKKLPSSAGIYARITVDGKNLEFSLKRKVLVINWDKKRSKLKPATPGANQLNQYLYQVRSEIFNAYEEIRREGKIISANSIKCRYFGEDDVKRSLIELIEYHYNFSEKTLSAGTLKMYRSTKNYILFFLEKEYKATDIFLNQL